MSDKDFTTGVVDRDVALSFRAGSGITTIVGGVVSVKARNVASGASVTGTAGIKDAVTVNVKFTAGSLSAGLWELQLSATPIGGQVTVMAEKIVIEPGV